MTFAQGSYDYQRIYLFPSEAIADRNLLRHDWMEEV